LAEIPENRVFPLDAVRLKLDEAEHPWLAANRAAVEAHWKREEVERPWLFNGTVMLHRDLRFDDGVIHGVSHRVPYAALLHLIRTWPVADARGVSRVEARDAAMVNAWHLYGSAVMLSSDGAMLLIRMASRTANAGKVYAPAGSLDQSDIAGGWIDVDGSIRREAREETGENLSSAQAEDRLLGWRFGGRVAIFRRFALAEPAEAIAQRMRAHIALAAEQEVDDIVIVRNRQDLGDTAPPYMHALLDFHFGC
jgi:8-oxo-dGTP pyrophosphatase MutT (NUDIX family)